MSEKPDVVWLLYSDYDNLVYECSTDREVLEEMQSGLQATTEIARYVRLDAVEKIIMRRAVDCANLSASLHMTPLLLERSIGQGANDAAAELQLTLKDIKALAEEKP